MKGNLSSKFEFYLTSANPSKQVDKCKSGDLHEDM